MSMAVEVKVRVVRSATIVLVIASPVAGLRGVT